MYDKLVNDRVKKRSTSTVQRTYDSLSTIEMILVKNTSTGTIKTITITIATVVLVLYLLTYVCTF